MWQIEFAYVSIQGWIVDPYTQCFFYCSFEVLVFPPHYTEIINIDIMTSGVGMFKCLGRCQIPPETAKILHRVIFWFFLKDEEFVSKTINEGSVVLDMLPASKVCQLAKKMKSSKATARHIKQVAGDPQVAQTNLMCHQCTELSNGKYKKKKSSATQKRVQHKNVEQRPPN